MDDEKIQLMSALRVFLRHRRSPDEAMPQELVSRFTAVKPALLLDVVTDLRRGVTAQENNMATYAARLQESIDAVEEARLMYTVARKITIDTILAIEDLAGTEPPRKPQAEEAIRRAMDLSPTP